MTTVFGGPKGTGHRYRPPEIAIRLQVPAESHVMTGCGSFLPRLCGRLSDAGQGGQGGAGGEDCREACFDPSSVPKWPFSRIFGSLPWVYNSKQPEASCLCIPNGLGTTLEKIISPPLTLPQHVHSAPLFGANWAMKGVGSVEIFCKCSHSSVFITTRVPKVIHGSQAQQRKVILEKVTEQ